MICWLKGREIYEVNSMIGGEICKGKSWNYKLLFKLENEYHECPTYKIAYEIDHGVWFERRYQPIIG